MKTRLFAVMLAVFAVCSVASAQVYSIRADSRNNLRSCAGFNCRVIETVPVGTVLQVVGEFNRWLKISRNGAEVWMANWIDHSRVEPGEQASSPPASNVDNCCFVDRQCQSDEEWSSGFWAFQNNQCTAPSSSLSPASSSPPASVDPSQIDNCCFLDWLCTTDEQWQSGYQAFQTNQCKHPGIVIEGSADFTIWVEAALDLLKNNAPDWYVYMDNGLDKVIEDWDYGVDTGRKIFFYHPRTPEVDFERDVVWLATVLVHEACHVYRDQAGFPYGTVEERFREEVVCQQIQIDSLKVIDPQDRYDFGDYLQELIDDFFSQGYKL